jgi:RNA polymerase sigma factor (sigma-70 family)
MQVKRSSMLPGNGRSLYELSEMSTVELVKLAQSGELEAFDPLYRRFSKRLFAYVVSRAYGDEALADDVVAETWEAAMNRIGLWMDWGRSEDDFVRWLVGMAKRRLLKARSGAWAEVPAGGASGDDGRSWLEQRGDGAESAGAGSVEPSGELQQMRAQLHERIEALPQVQRTVVRMRMDGAGNEEIAAAIGGTVQNVKDAWQHARRGLRTRLVQRADTQELFTAGPKLAPAIDALPPVQRRVVRMRLAGESFAAIAEKTGRGEAAVKSAWKAGKARLQEWLIDPNNGLVPDPEQAARDAAAVERLRQAAHTLAPTQKKVALLRLNGMRMSEIVRATGMPRGTVTATWCHAKKSFARQGLTVA